MPKKTTRGIYKSFFFKDHHPVLDAIDRVYELAGVIKANGAPRFAKIAEYSGVTEGTLRNWRSRRTKRPHDAGVEAVLRGLGAERIIRFQNNVIRYGTSSRPTTLTVIENERALQALGRGRRRAG